MYRRKFLNSVVAFLSGIIALPRNLFSEPGPDQYPARSFTVTINFRGKESTVGAKKVYGQPYISLEEFSRATGSRTYTNSARQKTVLYVGGDKIKFTKDNGFVVINDHLVQIINEPIWSEGELWVSASALADLFTKNTSHQMRFSESKMAIEMDRKNVNISNVVLSTKDNGMLIRIYAEKQFSGKDVSLKIANGWLYVDIFGGIADVRFLSNKKSTGLISETRAVQFEQMVSIAFHLKKSIKSKEVVFSPNSNDIFVNLRTDEQMAEDNSVHDELERQKKEWLVDTIIIDPGHGGKDPGAIGYGKLKEKDVVLQVGLKLGKIIRKKMPGVKVDYTRSSDVFIPLWKRPKMANEKNGKLFISLHCNSNRSRRPSGFETYFLSAEKDDRARDVVLKENGVISFEEQEDQKRYEGVNFILATMAQNAFIKQSQYLASVIQRSLAQKLKPSGLKDRGVKQAGFLVMVGATMPNILIEMGFISNKHEARLLKQRSHQTNLAQAIFDGISKYKNDIENAI